MDEFELLIAIVVGIFKLIRFIVVSIFRLIAGAFRFIGRAQRGGELSPRKQPERAAPPKLAKTGPAKPPALPAARSAPTRAAADQVKTLSDALSSLARNAEAESLACAREPANAPFVPTLDGIARRANESVRAVAMGASGAQVAVVRAAAEQLENLLSVVKLMASERRNPALTDLLGDSDALAAACYRPIVDFCTARGIPLASDRTATIIGGDKLYLLAVDDPSGLAPIVLPELWATDLGWWPALAHEIGHDFYLSIRGLDAELRNRLTLPRGKGLPSGGQLTTRDVDSAVGAWQEELFADAFGTFMLGPSYVSTMARLFAKPSAPNQACAAQRDDAGTGYEEHPPGHVRVAAACRLLARMGYGAEADRLEATWRKLHGSPDRVFLPTRANTWVAIDDQALIARAHQLGATLYETGLDVLNGIPLRSIPGLDFGPREHELAKAARETLAAGRRPANTRDPRLLIAGAVQAWVHDAARAPLILQATRDAIDGLPADLRLRASVRAAAEALADANTTPLLDAALVRDAILLDALLTRPRRKRA